MGKELSPPRLALGSVFLSSPSDSMATLWQKVLGNVVFLKCGTLCSIQKEGSVRRKKGCNGCYKVTCVHTRCTLNCISA